ncbi:MAG: NADH-quinone oxidoreductase subunit G [endosymbiont of Escarpia spicata]|uniref:NADH-quinone oxidoreductase n=1 Tax=endosymbiont of Escarpia spicata TaxID=2200908 RepID=A0A370DQ55_9GAMM|nr:MAG: NADH-quinone oxidoreductase subunit G [endosymbiont of Escarpia spicata]
MTQDSMVTIEVNGRELKAKAGDMLIEVTDEAGIDIPRFCYHKKLSISASCRQCLVEVKNAPKPLPACATPVMEGMKVFTHSPLALAAQKGTMEFLLINHPLDCPICDQGGECELQDVAVSCGSDVSRFVEGKRVVPAKNIGPLIATEMTRCIHCTRCVRFGEEIAGIREMGATGRGEHMVIGTYIEKSIDSELSGNIIDLCPVGALTSKPFRFSARAWELTQVEGVAPHDSVGSNLHLHLRGNKVMRVAPKDNESINECWISDRDRFSYQGLYSDDRLTVPKIKQSGEWQDVTWEVALDMAAAGLQEIGEGEQIATLVSPSSTLEELYLAQKVTRGLGSNNIDYRLRQGDFRLDGAEPAFSWLGLKISEIENLNAALLVGSNTRKEQPILAHNLRKAAVNGAKVHFINPLQLELNYTASQQVTTPAGMVQSLAAVAKALGATGEGAAAKVIDKAVADDDAKAIASALKDADKAAVMLGNIAAAHPDYSILCVLASMVANASGATFGFLAEAANSVGARLAGAMPDLLPGAKVAAEKGLDVMKLQKLPRKGYLLLGAEPGYDFWDAGLTRNALESADLVVALNTHTSPALEAAADIMLPIAAFAETSGTYVNTAGEWQSFRGAVKPLGEARPAWKVLRVLGNLLDQEDCEYTSSEQVRDELASLCEGVMPDNSVGKTESADLQSAVDGLIRIGDVPPYALDSLVRRASALQQTKDAAPAAICINAEEAKKAGLADCDSAVVTQDGREATLPVSIDANIPDGCVRISAGLAGTETLGAQFGEVTLEKA